MRRLQRGDGFGLVARFDDGVALRFERMAQHRPQRVFVFDEEDRGIGRRRGRTVTAASRADTARGALLLRESAMAFLSFAMLLLEPIELGERLLPVAPDHGALRRIVAGAKSAVSALMRLCSASANVWSRSSCVLQVFHPRPTSTPDLLELCLGRRVGWLAQSVGLQPFRPSCRIVACP